VADTGSREEMASKMDTRMHAHTHTPFYGPHGFFPGLPRLAGTRKVKPGS